MLSLEMELIAVLLLTAVVGILMGRFLCKNGENEERRKKKKAVHAFQTSEHELEISREQLKEHSFKMTELEDTIARREQQIRNMETKLLGSDKQGVKLLDELKILEKYKPRFESLTSEFNIQNKEIEQIKTEKIADKKKIEDLNISNHKLERILLESRQRVSELESNIEQLKQTLKKERTVHTNSEEGRREEFQLTLQKSNQKQIKELNSKNKAYEKLEQELNKKYKNIIRQKDEAYETLEHNKTKTYQKMIESKHETYQELREEYESLDNEYEEFKLNYNLDNDRLTTLENENKKIYQTLETIIIERDDLLARLRAISSVVNAIGIENSNKQLLLEK